MKKKILALCLVVVLAVTAVTGATLAYFTDKDADVNVMTAGNVKIVQNETDRNGDAYVDGQPLLPAVYFDEEGKPYNPTTTWEGPKSAPTGGELTVVGPDGVNMEMYGDSLENEIDKVISVTNKGTLPAYIRTIILIENQAKGTTPNIMQKLHINKNADKNEIEKEEWLPIRAEINGVLYSVGVFTYKNPLAAGATSPASLRQIWLDPSADNAWYDLLGDGKLNIVAISQAAQTTGFDSAAEALNTAFGEVTAENVVKWAAETNIDTINANNVVGGTVEANPETVKAALTPAPAAGGEGEGA